MLNCNSPISKAQCHYRVIILYSHSTPGLFANEHRVSTKQSEQAWEHFMKGGMPTKVSHTALTCAAMIYTFVLLESPHWQYSAWKG